MTTQGGILKQGDGTSAPGFGRSLVDPGLCVEVFTREVGAGGGKGGVVGVASGVLSGGVEGLWSLYSGVAGDKDREEGKEGEC